MSQHPAVETRLAAELDAAGLLVTRACPQPRALAYADLSRLTYLQCVLKVGHPSLHPWHARAARAASLRPKRTTDMLMCACIYECQPRAPDKPAGSWDCTISARNSCVAAPDTSANSTNPCTKPYPCSPVTPQEAQRLYSVAPLVVRRALRDVRLGGIAVPAGTCLLLHVYAMHTTSANWAQPHAFLPVDAPAQPAPLQG